MFAPLTITSLCWPVWRLVDIERERRRNSIWLRHLKCQPLGPRDPLGETCLALTGTLVKLLLYGCGGIKGIATVHTPSLRTQTCRVFHFFFLPWQNLDAINLECQEGIVECHFQPFFTCCGVVYTDGSKVLLTCPQASSISCHILHLFFLPLRPCLDSRVMLFCYLEISSLPPS